MIGGLGNRAGARAGDESGEGVGRWRSGAGVIEGIGITCVSPKPIRQVGTAHNGARCDRHGVPEVVVVRAPRRVEEEKRKEEYSVIDETPP